MSKKEISINWEKEIENLGEIFHGIEPPARFEEFKKYCETSHRSDSVFERLVNFVEMSLSRLNNKEDKKRKFIGLINRIMKNHSKKDILIKQIPQLTEDRKVEACIEYMKDLIEGGEENEEKKQKAIELLNGLGVSQKHIAAEKIIEYIKELQDRKPLSEKFKIFLKDIFDKFIEGIGKTNERVIIKQHIRKVLEGSSHLSKEMSKLKDKVGYRQNHSR